MFIDEEREKEEKQAAKNAKNKRKKTTSLLGKEKRSYFTKKTVFYAALVFSLASLSLTVVFYPDILREKPKAVTPSGGDSGGDAAGFERGLPEIPEIETWDPFGLDGSMLALKAEDLMFGHFYKETGDDFRPDLRGYDLPLNVKSDADNYYDISRKINLDPYVDDLNERGFAVFTNPFGKEARDFLEMYHLLISKRIPIVITDDFLLYYFQNVWKLAFKEIEKNAFYDNFWRINKKMYEIALTRYKERAEEAGMVNDPLLEGARLETEFFAVALKLMMPFEKQVNRNVNLIDSDKFNTEEENYYYAQFPKTIAETVAKEEALIRAGKGTSKSPSFLYPVNYGHFGVPDSYRHNAKLNNFYLTLKWYNSVFPLYHKSEQCPDCLLDRNDWLINMAAAGFIARDLAANQDIKNQWAVIYKFISFFSGLRGDLTYLHYDGVFRELYGDDYEIEKIFGRDDAGVREETEKIREKLAALEFTGIEGGIGRGGENEPEVGMRLLQEPYWPDDYIFNQFIGRELTADWDWITGKKPSGNTTSCRGETDKAAPYRCRAVSADLVNVFYPLDGDNVFEANAAYEHYGERAEAVREEFARFDVFTWNNNVYWTTLDAAGSLFGRDAGALPAYAASEDWVRRKTVNTFLGAWVNVHLPEDNFANYHEQEKAGLDLFYADAQNFIYIEPTLGLVREMMAKNAMLMRTLTALRVSDKTNVSVIDLRELNDLLKKTEVIMKKILSNAPLDRNDSDFLKDIVTRYTVERRGVKTATINFSGGRLEEGIAGVKLLAVVYRNGDKTIIGIGPVFNYGGK